ncbi:MAG: cold shock domain-containing protein [Abitibacteriaceae bacterium]|nr:cold shock domain-containing protein [Abditibacteriaceae bacterium]
MPIGRVKWWNDNQGFGFITLPNGQEVFVHHSKIQTDDYAALEEGQLVECEVIQAPKGLMAHNVREPGSKIQSSNAWANTAPRQIKIFLAQSTRRAEYEINQWLEETGFTLLSASMTNADDDGYIRVIIVFSIV